MNENLQFALRRRKTHPLLAVLAICILALGFGASATTEDWRNSLWRNPSWAHRIAQVPSPALIGSRIETKATAQYKYAWHWRGSWRARLLQRCFGSRARVTSEANGTCHWARGGFALDVFSFSSGVLSGRWHGVFGIGCGLAQGNSGCTFSFGMEDNID